MNETPRPLTKRHRALIACNTCRHSKAKCDSEGPPCGRCRKQKIECVYAQTGRDRRLDRQEERRVNLELKSRVKDLESQLASVSQPGSSPAKERMRNGSIDGHSVRSHAPSSLAGSSTYLGRGLSRSPSNNETVTDVLATEIFDHPTISDVGYFGPSSNHALFRSVASEIVQLGYRSTRTTNNLEHSNAGHIRASGDGPETNSVSQPAQTLPVDSRTTEIIFPGREETFKLIERFFDTIGTVMPCINESSLLREANAFSVQPGPCPSMRRDVKALLSIVLAYSLTTIAGASPDALYLQALALLDDRAMNLPTLDSLQAMVLLGSFQQNSHRAISSWTSHSLAVKMAYQLGIHAPWSYEHLGTDERGLRAKLWFAIVNQDRTLCAALGRPCLIPMSHVSEDLFEMLPCIRHGTYGNMVLPQSSLAYFRQVISLNQITGAAVELLYGSNIGNLKASELKDTIMKTIDLSQQLDNWRERVAPFHIMSDLASQVCLPMIFESRKYDILLSLHYYRAVLFINSPLLLGSIHETTAYEKDIHFGILRQASGALLKNDLEVAKELFSAVSVIMDQRPEFFAFNASWWKCNFTVLTSCLHLLAFWLLSVNNRSCFQSLGIGSFEIEAFLNDAIDVLKAIGKSSIMSQKANRCLRRYQDFLRSLGGLYGNDQMDTIQSIPGLPQPLDLSLNESLSFGMDTSIMREEPENLPSLTAKDLFEILDPEESNFEGLSGLENKISDIDAVGYI